MLALLAVCLLPAEASGASCLREGEKVLKRGGLVDVVRTADFDHVACLRADGRRTELDDAEEDVELRPELGIRISGHFVSYITETSFPAGSDTAVSLEVADVRRRRTWPVTTAENCAPTEDWVLNGRGSVAWIARDCSSRREVWRCLQPACEDPDSDAAERLDRGAIRPRSLTRRGDRIRWVKSGAVRSARFR